MSLVVYGMWSPPGPGIPPVSPALLSAVGGFVGTTYNVEELSFYLSLWICFIMNILTISNIFSASIEMIIRPFSLILLIWWITLIDFEC